MNTITTVFMSFALYYSEDTVVKKYSAWWLLCFILAFKSQKPLWFILKLWGKWYSYDWKFKFNYLLQIAFGSIGSQKVKVVLNLRHREWHNCFIEILFKISSRTGMLELHSIFHALFLIPMKVISSQPPFLFPNLWT